VFDLSDLLNSLWSDVSNLKCKDLFSNTQTKILSELSLHLILITFLQIYFEIILEPVVLNPHALAYLYNAPNVAIRNFF